MVIFPVMKNDLLIKHTYILIVYLAEINAVDWSSDSKLLLTGSSDSSVKVVDVQTQAILYYLTEIHSGILSYIL